MKKALLELFIWIEKRDGATAYCNTSDLEEGAPL